MGKNASQLRIPGTDPVDMRNHANVGKLDGSTYRLTVPIFLLIFDDDQSKGTSEPMFTPEQQGQKLNDDFALAARWYRENSHGRFEVEFLLRTVYLDNPRSWRGGNWEDAKHEPVYDSDGNLTNEGDLISAKDFEGYAKLVLWKTKPKDEVWARNYNKTGERNMIEDALAKAKDSDPAAWDAQMTLAELLARSIPPGDTQAFLGMTSMSLTGGQKTAFGDYRDNASDNGSLVLNPIQFDGRTLRNYFFWDFYDVAWERWKTAEESRTEVMIHEMTHTLGVGDLYNIDGDAALDVRWTTMMGATGEPKFAHLDAYTKFRFNWLTPQVIEPHAHRRRYRLPPVYRSSDNALLLRPDSRGHADEFFLLEVRRPGDKRWDDQPLEFDGLRDDQKGMLIYHINAENSSKDAPFMAIEDADTSTSDAHEAFREGHHFSGAQTKLYDGTNTGLIVEVVDVESDGTYVIDVGWGRNSGEVDVLACQPRRVYTVATHDGWRSSWTMLVAGALDYGGVTDLLAYDASAGVGEILRSDGRGRFTRLRLHTGWRRTWTHIVYGDFGGNPRDAGRDVLFYDGTRGDAELYRVAADGSMTCFRRFRGWRTTWTALVVGQFNRGGRSELLFYDASAGEAEICRFGLGGAMSPVVRFDGWRRTWTQIVAAQFSGSDASDLLFYDRTAGEAEVYRVDEGKLQQIARHTGWRKSWTNILAGDFGWRQDSPQVFGSAGYADLLLYDRTAGEAEVLSSNGSGEFRSRSTHRGWRRSWDLISAGDFITRGNDDLVFYTRSTVGEGVVFQVGARGRLSETSSHPGWRRTWSHIVAGNFAGGSERDELFFYDPTQREAELWRLGGDGRTFQLVDQFTNLRSSWDIVVAGQFGGTSASTELLCYDAGAQLGEFHRVRGGKLVRIGSPGRWRRTWSHIVYGRFGGGAELAFYDPTDGTLAFYSVSNGRMTKVAEHRTQTTWTHVVPGAWAGAEAGLLLYSRMLGKAEFVDLDGARLRVRHQASGWRRTWSQILIGDFGGSTEADAMFYDAIAGEAEFFELDASGRLGRKLQRARGWRHSWEMFVLGNFTAASRQDVLGYDRVCE